MRALVLVLSVVLCGLATSRGRAQEMPFVNVQNANVTLGKVELALDWAGPQFQISRVYNSRSRTFTQTTTSVVKTGRRRKRKKAVVTTVALPLPQPLGRGWSLSYSQRVLVALSGGQILSILEPDGALSTYQKAADSPGRFDSPSGRSHHWVQKTSTGFERHRKGLTETFNAAGALTGVRDGVGRSLTMTQGSRGLETIADSTGRTVRFTLDQAGRVTSVVDPLERRVTYEYDPKGLLVRATDVMGAQTQYEYDAKGKLTTITYPGGGVAQIGYDLAHGWCQSLELPGKGKRTYQFGFDPKEPARTTATVTTEWNQAKETWKFEQNGQVRARVDAMGESTTEKLCPVCNGFYVTKNPLGNGWKHAHSPDGLQHEVSDPLGNKVVARFAPGTGQPVALTSADGTKDTYTFDAKGQRVGKVASDGSQTRVVRDPNGNGIAVDMPNGTSWKMKYDTLGFPSEITDPLGGITRHTRDLAGRLVKCVDPDGRVSELEYNPAGLVTTVTLAGGKKTRYSYDEAGRVTAIVDAAGRRTATSWHACGKPARIQHPNGAVTKYTYDADGNLLTTVQEGGVSYKFEYDLLGRVVSCTDALGQKTKLAYDAAGQLVTTTDPTGAVTRRKYDAAGQAIEIVDALGRVRKRNYSPGGSVNCEVAPDGLPTFFKYDARGRLTQKIDFLGRAEKWAFDETDRRTSYVDAAGNKASWKYDALGRIVQYDDPLQGRYRYSYTPGGQLASTTYPDGRVVKIKLDDAFATRTVALPGGETVVTNLDVLGNRIEEVGPGYHHRWSYDDGGFVQSVVDVKTGRQQRYVYDEFGQRRVWVDADGRQTTYKYDDARRLIEVNDRLGFVVQYAYDAANRRIRRDIGSGPRTDYRWDQAGQLNAIEHSLGGKSLAKYVMTRSPGGVVRAVADDDRSVQLTLDPSGRITKAVGVVEAPTELRFDFLDNVVQTVCGAAIDKRQVTVEGQTRETSLGRLRYDAWHNLQYEPWAKGGLDCRYDDLRRLVSVKTPAESVSFSYGPDSRWLGWTAGKQERRFDYDVDQLVAEYDSAGKVLAEYAHGDGLDEPLAWVSGKLTHFLLTDFRNSVRRIVDSKGEVAAELLYDLYGVQARKAGDSGCLFGFTGRPQDPFSGLVNLRARWLNPRLGAFMTPDMMQLQWRYMYGWGNPISYLDPLGAGVGSWIAAGLTTAAAVVGAAAIAGAVATAAPAIVAGAVTAGVWSAAAGVGVTGVAAAWTDKTPAQVIKAQAVSAVVNGTVGAFTGGVGAITGAAESISAALFTGAVGTMANTVGQGVGGYVTSRSVYGNDVGDSIKAGYQSALGGAFGGALGGLAGMAFPSAISEVGTILSSVLSNVVQATVDTTIPSQQQALGLCDTVFGK